MTLVSAVMVVFGFLLLLVAGGLLDGGSPLWVAAGVGLAGAWVLYGSRRGIR